MKEDEVSEELGPPRVIYRGSNMEVSTNIPGFKWPTRSEKIAGLLSAGLIDQAEADRLSAKFPDEEPPHA